MLPCSLHLIWWFPFSSTSSIFPARVGAGWEVVGLPGRRLPRRCRPLDSSRCWNRGMITYGKYSVYRQPPFLCSNITCSPLPLPRCFSRSWRCCIIVPAWKRLGIGCFLAQHFFNMHTCTHVLACPYRPNDGVRLQRWCMRAHRKNVVRENSPFLTFSIPTQLYHRIIY